MRAFPLGQSSRSGHDNTPRIPHAATPQANIRQLIDFIIARKRFVVKKSRKQICSLWTLFSCGLKKTGFYMSSEAHGSCLLYRLAFSVF